MLRVLYSTLFGLHSVLFLSDGREDLIIEHLLLLLVIVLDLRHQLLKRLETSLSTHVFRQGDTARR